ncbi:type I-F CRISPR-associated protein Csy1 [Vitreoscilla massiliensis]|uniref:Type I-F CRISPR-associated protein Csy1 n=1 Tax=Vitreoscilla massiliensis TaxID=1689272 RepID=A0ABY4E0I4_9NEIS|nr:type I-F CRISPR-associated protein Csy1 [Vitreoscilla massiliensis]UOO88880.1 type I-F CRISPR-associated protein Csy1 [Vitreoscilla massiliensis]
MQQQAINAVYAFLQDRKNKKLENEAKKNAQISESKLEQINTELLPQHWFQFIADNAHQVSLGVTHVAKLTHSSSKASNLKDVVPQTDFTYLVSTQTSGNVDADGAYTNAIWSPIGDFLSLAVENSTLGELFVQHPEWFASFAPNSVELQTWHDKISSAYIPKELSSHVLAKQVYFPVEDGYHLLSPMTSSALVQLLYDRIQFSRSKDNPIKLAFDKQQYHSETHTKYPNVAVLNITKSNHQNASKLNSKRIGRQYLLCAEPPQWRVSERLPKSNFFKDCAYSFCLNKINKLKKLWQVIISKKLSLNHHNRQLLQKRAGQIAEQVLLLATGYAREQAAGWLEGSQLSQAQQYWLDPYRDDVGFQQDRVNNDWESSIVIDFSLWLNDLLRIQGDNTAKLWRDAMAPELRRFVAWSDVKEYE